MIFSSQVAPWAGSVLFVCARQNPAPDIWADETASRAAAQRALAKCAGCHWAALKRKYGAALEVS